MIVKYSIPAYLFNFILQFNAVEIFIVKVEYFWPVTRPKIFKGKSFQEMINNLT